MRTVVALGIMALCAACEAVGPAAPPAASLAPKPRPAVSTIASAPPAPSVIALDTTPAFDSVHTDLSDKSCRLVERSKDPPDYTMAYDCKGVAGFHVRLAYDDERAYVSVEPPGGGPLPIELDDITRHFREVGPKAEWRTPRDGDAQLGLIFPLRWTERADDGAILAEPEVLVVARVTAKEACLVGAIDARRHAHASERARRLADARIVRSCAEAGLPAEQPVTPE